MFRFDHVAAHDDRAGSGLVGSRLGLTIAAHAYSPDIDLFDAPDAVLATLRARPREVHVVLTGRRCPPELIELADTVTEMTKIKHAFNAGIPAQRGIED